MHAENSDVSPNVAGEPGTTTVAVDVMIAPAGAGKVTPLNDTLPSSPVVSVVAPMSVRPSPKPLESHAPLEKNSMRKAVLRRLLSEPEIVMLPPLTAAETSTG